jgi:taurine dioxygenase|tara:strand:- start:405 stop:1268 length:864 start_codon:yes stop_codon:yes gene_type:complete
MNIHFNTKKDFQNIEVFPTAGALGAQIENVNLSDDLSEEVVNEIYDALLTYQVIFFRDQEFDPKSQKAFAKKIGNPIVYPFVKSLEDFPEITPILKKETDVNNFGGIWHSDTTYQAEPPMGTMLYGIEIPKYGGDTEWSNQYLAYESLSDGMKKFLDTLEAVNISGKARVAKTRSDIMKHASVGLKGDELKAIHPVVRTHPETKKKSLYVNEAHTTNFVGMTEEESTPILEFLFKHQIKSEFTCRFQWKPGSVAIWDNRCTMHNPINDYHGQRRLMHRITFAGDKPM